jgi:signal transduction histidine kinase
MTRRWLVIVGAAGAAATAGLSFAVGMTWLQAVRIATVAGLTGLGGWLVGGSLLLALRRRSAGTQITIVALTCIGAVGAGAAAAARAMFLGSHDLHELLVILLAAGTAGVLVAMVLGRRVSIETRSLGEATRRIGEGPLVVDRPSTAELAALAAEMEAMSTRLEDARQREQILDASRRELVAWVSHDLRTPLAGIRAMVEALEDGVVTDPDTVARYHRTLRMEADRLAALVDDLFELSMIQAGALHMQMERASLGDLLSDAIAAATVFAQTKGVRLEGRVDGTAPDLALSTPQITRVLRNLLQNAIRHTPKDGTVVVETRAEEGYACLAVTDECGGIPEADLPRVFDTAFRGELARSPQADRSAGLGLAIAKGIVEAHEGEISVRNEGAGCRFTVRLRIPATTEPHGATPASATAAAM